MPLAVGETTDKWLLNQKKCDLKNCVVDVIPDFKRGFNSSNRDTIKIQAFSNSLTTFQLFEKDVRKI